MSTIPNKPRELEAVNLNNRLNAVRSKVIEHLAKGTLGVVAAKSKVAEGSLRTWIERPELAPNKDECTALEYALGMHGDSANSATG